MTPDEYGRQLDQLRIVIADGIACFSAWRSLMVGDENSTQALNQYRGLFLPPRNVLLGVALLQFAKVFDRDPRTGSLPNLLAAAKKSRDGLCPHHR